VRICLVLLAAACTSSAAAPGDPPPIAKDKRRWIPGDVHMHVAPPDRDVDLNVAGIAKAARDGGLEFVVLTPHLWPSARGRSFDTAWRAMATEARATKGVTLIPGIEWTTGNGHFTIAGVDVTALGPDLLRSAHDAGAFISVNHPYAVPTKIPGIAVSHYNMSYRPWTEGRPAPVPIHGVEVWNFALGIANVIRKPGGKTGEARAWESADALVRKERKKLAAVGGTDNHTHLVIPTTWVLAEQATEAAILDALRAGATCVGGPEAGSLRARGTSGEWVRIGGVVRGDRVELAWDGTARLFIDGVDRGEHAARYVHATNGAPHTYRIAVGPSRCGFVYGNL
jgi:hypothetical protein